MDWSVISTVVGIAFTVGGAVGALLVRAYINPLNRSVEQNMETSKDHEKRIRQLESMGSEHGIHLENLMKAVDRLVSKIDEFVTFETVGRRGHNDN